MNGKPSINQIITKLIEMRIEGKRITLLAICPNSDAVLEAAIKCAAENSTPMLFAATLNQVDRDGGYTGWTPSTFVSRMMELAVKYSCTSPLYPCLDHGGPWLKDTHNIHNLSLVETMNEVKESFKACLQAGYSLLHIDPTVDRTLPKGQPPAISSVIERTIELISFIEEQRLALNLPPVSYEVGTEEVHGGLVDIKNFEEFLDGLYNGLQASKLLHAWPCFIVGKVGTDLHTINFDPEVAHKLYERVSPLGSLIKGHYTDLVANPQEYPHSGMGGANVGPEFTFTELNALYILCDAEDSVCAHKASLTSSHFRDTIKSAVLDSNRWEKWLLPDEVGLSFDDLTHDRQDWLIGTGARYVWTHPQVLGARRLLYTNLASQGTDPHCQVIDCIAQNMQKYIDAFNLRNSIHLF